MGKSNKTNKNSNPNASSNVITKPALETLKTTTAIASDPTLGYKLRVLLYDFTNVVKDSNSAHRINDTTDEHYISLPYFNSSQAAAVKSALVDVDISQLRLPGADEEEAVDEALGIPAERGARGLKGKSFEEAITILLETFIDKRRASGDARPCGPHHLGPLYASLFGVDLDDIKQESFLRRLKRRGL
jgi:hypothetical protein